MRKHPLGHQTFSLLPRLDGEPTPLIPSTVYISTGCSGSQRRKRPLRGDLTLPLDRRQVAFPGGPDGYSFALRHHRIPGAAARVVVAKVKHFGHPLEAQAEMVISGGYSQDLARRSPEKLTTAWTWTLKKPLFRSFSESPSPNDAMFCP